jgi:hypothetical protein
LDSCPIAELVRHIQTGYPMIVRNWNQERNMGAENLDKERFGRSDREHRRFSRLCGSAKSRDTSADRRGPRRCLVLRGHSASSPRAKSLAELAERCPTRHRTVPYCRLRHAVQCPGHGWQDCYSAPQSTTGLAAICRAELPGAVTLMGPGPA